MDLLFEVPPNPQEILSVAKEGMYGDEGRQEQDIFAQPARSTGEQPRPVGGTRTKSNAESRPAPAGRKSKGSSEEAAAAKVAIIVMSEVLITEPAILIRIAQLYEPGMTAEQLYEATRGVWKIGERRESVRYALSVAHGIVREVYEIYCWHPAASTNYTTRPIRSVNVTGRWEFTGSLAPPAIRSKYIGHSVAHYFNKGNANPIMYVDS